MAKLLKLRRGTTTQHGSFTGAEGEVTIDTTKDTAVVHDGSQAGGRPLAREDMANVSSSAIAGRLSNDSLATSKLAAGALPTDVTIQRDNITSSSIRNSEVHASAAIAGTKISPDFGSQTITTTGEVRCAGATLTGELNLMGTESGKYMDFNIGSNLLALRGTTGGETGHTNMATFARTGATTLNFNGNPKIATTSGGIGVTGGITASGSIDLEDASEVKLGTDDDFILSYDDTNNQALIAMASGKRLKLKCDSLHINNAADNSNILLADDTGSVSLFHGTSKKFETQSGGAQVTGNLAVTGTVDGRDVAADGTKLDGIESGATADQSASEILTLIKTVDGNGSGLDADSVDGISAQDFLRSDTADTAAGDITFSGGAGAVTIAADSDIRLANGTWTGNHYAKIQHHDNRLYLAGGSGGFRFRKDGTDTATLDASGNFTAIGNITAYSDAKLKTDISTINDALSICGKLRGVSYKWLRDGSAGIGVIAQEVEEIIPEVVLTNIEKDVDTGTETEVKSVDYGKIVGVLINAINELKEEVVELKNAKITG